MYSVIGSSTASRKSEPVKQRNFALFSACDSSFAFTMIEPFPPIFFCVSNIKCFHVFEVLFLVLIRSGCVVIY